MRYMWVCTECHLGSLDFAFYGSERASLPQTLLFPVCLLESRGICWYPQEEVCVCSLGVWVMLMRVSWVSSHTWCLLTRQSVVLDVDGIQNQVEDYVLPSEGRTLRRKFEIQKCHGYLHKISSLTFEKPLIEMQGSQLSKERETFLIFVVSKRQEQITSSKYVFGPWRFGNSLVPLYKSIMSGTRMKT